MSIQKNGKVTYRVKVLDIKFQKDANLLNFKYINYKVKAKHSKEAIKKARTLYMNDEQGESMEEFPILLKLFCTETV